MANYITVFSFAIPNLTDAEAAWGHRAAAWLDADPDQREAMPELAEMLDDPDGYPSFRAEVDDDGLWIHSDESGSPGEAARLVQAFLAAFRLDDTVAFEWADTCSRPILDAFGGGAMLVTATDIESTHTGAWIAERLAARAAAAPAEPA